MGEGFGNLNIDLDLNLLVINCFLALVKSYLDGCAACTNNFTASIGLLKVLFSELYVSGAEIAQMVCGSCQRLLSYPKGEKNVQCSCCQMVNFVLQGVSFLL